MNPILNLWYFKLIWSNRSHSLKCQMSTILDCKDIGIGKSEFVTKTKFLCPWKGCRHSLTLSRRLPLFSVYAGFFTIFLMFHLKTFFLKNTLSPLMFRISDVFYSVLSCHQRFALFVGKPVQFYWKEERKEPCLIF